MKRIVLLLLLTISGSLVAKPRTTLRPKVMSSSAELNKQIASHVTYPTVLHEGGHKGIVVISFSVAENNRLAKLTVHTANQELNDDLTRQLVGKRIRLSDNNPFETYTVRLRFAR